MSRRPIVIGVTGGIGAGKSTAVEAFARRGAAVFSADAAVHDLYRTDEVREPVCARWGDDVVNSSGAVDRARVADIVFAQPEELAWLESLLHPLVAREWLRFLDRAGSTDTPPEFVVAEVPLLFEAGLGDRYDATVLITAPLALRLVRVGERAQGTGHAEVRAARQMSEQQQAELADFSFVNAGDPEKMVGFVDDVIKQVRSMPSRARAGATDTAEDA